MSEDRSHISSEALKKYLSGSLSELESKQLNDAIEDDSFEKEALEGFDTIEDKEALLAAVKSIERSVAQRTGMRQERKLSIPIWKMMGIAASVLFLVIGAFSISHFLKSEEQVVVNTTEIEKSDLPEPETETGMGPEIVEIPLEQESLQLESADLVERVQQNLQVQDAEAPKSQVLDNSSFQAEEDESLKEVVLPMPKNDASSVYDELAEELEQEAPIPTTTVAKQKSAVKASSDLAPAQLTEEVAPSNSYFDVGKSNYDSKNYNLAMDYFEDAIKNNDNVTESQYYLAMSFYSLDKLNKAVKHFDTVIRISSSPLSNNAKWYKSLILEEKGANEEAIKLLKELANGNSGFKNQAKDKLKTFN